MRFHDWATGRLIREFAGVEALSATRDGSRALLARDFGGLVNLVKRETGTAVWTYLVYRSRGRNVRRIALSGDGKRAVLLLRDGTLLCLNASDGSLISEWKRPPDNRVLSISDDGSLIGIIDDNRTTRVFRLSDGTELFGFAGETGTRSTTSLSFSSDSKRIAIGWYAGPKANDGRGRVTILDSQTGQLLGSPPVGGSGGPSALKFTPHDGRLVVGSDSWQVDEWDFTSDRQVALGTNGAPVFSPPRAVRMDSCSPLLVEPRHYKSGT